MELKGGKDRERHSQNPQHSPGYVVQSSSRRKQAFLLAEQHPWPWELAKLTEQLVSDCSLMLPFGLWSPPNLSAYMLGQMHACVASPAWPHSHTPAVMLWCDTAVQVCSCPTSNRNSTERTAPPPPTGISLLEAQLHAQQHAQLGLHSPHSANTQPYSQCGESGRMKHSITPPRLR